MPDLVNVRIGSLLNTYWTKQSPLPINSMLPGSILGDGEAGPKYLPRKHTIFDNRRRCVHISVLVFPVFHLLRVSIGCSADID